MGYLTSSWYYGMVAARSMVYGPPAIVSAGIFGNKAVSQSMMRRWCVDSTRLLGMQVSAHGTEHLASTQQAIFIANHLSWLDILVIGSILPQDYRWLAKSAVFKVPILGWHLAASGHIPVYRGKQRHRNTDIAERMRQVVAEGASLLFFPEGTRSKDGHLQSFRSGAFMAAIDSNLPVIPLAVRGTHELLEKGSYHYRPIRNHPVSVQVLAPIAPPPGETPKARARALRALAFQALLAELHPETVYAPGQEAAVERTPPSEGSS